MLVATQAIGRPLGLALDFLVAVVAAEEMPRNSRAYAVSVLAMASGLGAGIAVMALPLADIGESSWRLIYVRHAHLADRRRRHRQAAAGDDAVRLVRTRSHRRSTVGGSARSPLVALAANFFVAPASFFQNRYLEDVRGFSAAEISLFTLSTATPAGIGLIIGGRIADIRGRRHVLAVAAPAGDHAGRRCRSRSNGVPMWFSAFGGGFIGGIAYPALAVYRAELFPTGNRGRAAGLLTAAALLGRDRWLAARRSVARRAAGRTAG